MTKTEIYQGKFKGIMGGGMCIGDPHGIKKYPIWLYKDGEEPITVTDTDAEQEARSKGYDAVTAGSMANKYLVNWFWDLEDFSAKQLHYFALEEFGVDLPVEAGQEKLFKAVVELTKSSPKNKNRMVLMAHTIKMNYDETLEEIRRLIAVPRGATVENFSEEFTV